MKNIMFDNLYKFKKNAWHVRVFTWIYGTNPTIEFKTMCPYFWALVATFLFLPIILVIKLFGAAGTKFLNQILSNIKRDLQLLQKRGYKYNDNAIYQEWYAIRLLALYNFDLQESKHYIRVMWYEDSDEFDKCRDRKTHAINFEEISDIMNNIMRNVKVPKNYVYPENIPTKLL